MRRVLPILAFLLFESAVTLLFAQGGHDYVDLGLSVNWATCNVGADKPEDSGDFFAWGETSPYYESLDPLVWKEGKERGYNRNSASDNYNDRGSVFGTKQPAPASTSAKYSIETGAKQQLDPEDDAAHVNWGGSWRMPTMEECQELIDNCTWEATARNGVKGYEVKSKTNGNSIFLPAAGNYVGISNNPTIILDDENNPDAGQKIYLGCYWSATLSPNYSYRASYLLFTINEWNNILKVEVLEREYGCPIRPVCPKFFTQDIPEAGDWISGVVSDSLGPLAKVSVMELDTACIIIKTVPTSSEGLFSLLLINPNDSLRFSFDGYYDVTVPVDRLRYEITLQLDRTPKPDPRSLIRYGTGTEADHEYVDMGLSVKWATCNVGAEYPDDYGDYFAWGEISPYYESQDPLVWKEGAEKGYDNYTFNYSYDEKSRVRLYYGTPEILHVEYHKYKVDGKTQLDLENDAAHMNWGGAWRMPTDNEFKELIDSCTCTYSEMNGVSGYTFKSKITGNSVFFPGAGYYNGTKFFPIEKYEGGGRKSYGGVYWSSSLSTGYSHRASCLDLVRNRWSHVEERMVETYVTRNIMLRQVGTPIRPVCP